MSERDLKTWGKLLCISTIAWIMILLGLVVGVVADSYVSAPKTMENPANSALAVPMVISPIRYQVAQWVVCWFGIFLADQLVIKPIREYKATHDKPF